MKNFLPSVAGYNYPALSVLMRTVLLFCLVCSVFCSGASAQGVLTQTTAQQFGKGYFNNTTVAADKIAMPFKATAMNNWTQTTTLPRRVQNHQAVTWNNFVYVTGGIDVVGIVQGVELREISRKVYRTTVNNGLGTWTTMGDLPEGVMEHTSVIANGYLYVMGGINEDSVASDKIYRAKIRADGSLRSWETNGTDLPVPLWGHTADFVNGYIVITGGCNQDDTTAINNVYTVRVEPNGELTTFTAQPALGINRNQHATAVYNNRLFVLGGFDENDNITNAVVYTDIDVTGTCSAWQSAANLPEPLFGHSAVCEQGMLISTGGYNDNLGFSVQYAYYTDVTAGTSFTWNQSNLYYVHFAKSETFIAGGYLYVIGGYDIFNVTMDACYYNALSISGTDKLGSGNFLGEVFDLGLNRNVDNIYFGGPDLSNYTMYYRTAQNADTWGAWTDITDDFEVQINSNIRYVQYMFKVSGAPTNNTIALDTVQLNFAAVQLAGNYTDETWTLANSPYWVSSDVFINGTVNVEAGVSFSFSEGVKMQVNGILNCNGTSGSPITFTSFTGEDGYWNGLHFSGSSNTNNSTLDYVIIENAGFVGHAGLNCSYTNQPTMNNGTIRYCTNSALYCDGAKPVFNNTGFNYNSNYVIRLANGCGPVYTNCTSLSNLNNKIQITGGYASYDSYWSNFIRDYEVTGTLQVGPVKLLIDKGLTLKFASGQYLLINNGALWAEGSSQPDSAITFTSLSGSTNDWNGIQITGSNANYNKLKYCIVKNAAAQNLYIYNSNYINIDNCQFSNASGYGAMFNNVHDGNITNSSFFGNTSNGFYGDYGITNMLFNNCDFYNNGSAGFKCSGTVKLFNSHVYNNTGAGIHLTSQTPQVENTITENNTGSGIYTIDCDPDFINVTSQNNTANGFLMNANCQPEYYNFLLTGNNTNDIRVESAQIQRVIRWEKGAYPFVVTGNIYIGNYYSITSRLILGKGMTLYFTPNAGISVGGFQKENPSLWAQGGSHPDSVITFTSLSGLPGGWNGIYFDGNSTTSYLTNCIIENALSYNIGIAGGTSEPAIDSCIIRNAQYDGLNITGTLTINHSSIYGNGQHGLYGGGNFDLFNSHIHHNGQTGLNLTGGEPQVENVQIDSNGTNGIYASNCDPDLVNVNVIKNTGHGFMMDANCQPEFYNLSLTGNGTNDIRVGTGLIGRQIRWEKAAYPYVVIGTIYVGNYYSQLSRLTLGKGIKLYFDQNAGISIGGFQKENPSLWAQGGSHPDSVITFTSLSGLPGGWNGITFNSNSTASYLTNCIIENALSYNIGIADGTDQPAIDSCIIRNAQYDGINLGGSNTINHSIISGNGQYGINGTGSFDLLNSRVDHNGQAGIYTTGGVQLIQNVQIDSNGTAGINVNNSDPEFVNVQSINNTGHGFVMNANCQPNFTNMTLSGNTTNDYRINGGVIARNITWRPANYPFIVIGSINVQSGRLTLSKGLTVKFSPATSISVGTAWWVGSSFWAEGVNHPDSMVTLTALNGQPGGWGGINFSSSTLESQLKYCIIEKAQTANVQVHYTSDVNISNCLITQSTGYGIYSYNGGYKISNSRVINNQNNGIYIYGNPVPTIGDTLGKGNDIFNNYQYEIKNESASNVNARHNFFNVPDLNAAHLRIYDNADNPSYGIVMIDPMSSSSCIGSSWFVSAKTRYHNTDTTAMNNVSVVLKDNLNVPFDTCGTSPEGFATFTGVPNGTYNLTAATTKPWAGVNATDALLVMQHFATIINLTGIRLLAGDVNASSSVNSTDALAILQRFAHVTSSFPAGDWAFQSETDPLVINNNSISTNYWALCYGDVNGSNVPSGSKATQLITLGSNGQLLVDDINVSLPVNYSNASPVGAVSLRIAYPASYITITGVTVNNSTSNVVYSTDNGVLSIAWCNLTPYWPNSGHPLLTIQFTINDITVFNNGLQLTLTGENELADNNAQPIDNVALTYPEIVSQLTQIEQSGCTTFDAWVNQNSETGTTLQYQLPEDGRLCIELFSAQGALCERIHTGNYKSGTYSFNLSAQNLSKGIYFIKMQYTGSTVRKEIMLKVPVL